MNNVPSFYSHLNQYPFPYYFHAPINHNAILHYGQEPYVFKRNNMDSGILNTHSIKKHTFSEYPNRIQTNVINIKTSFTKEEAAAIALLLGIDFTKSRFNLDEFWMGVNVELEHGKQSSQTNVTGDDPILTGKIALAHLNEFPDYYKRLKVLEEEAKAYWKK